MVSTFRFGQIVPPADVDVVMNCAEGSCTHRALGVSERPGPFQPVRHITRTPRGQARGLGDGLCQGDSAAPAPALETNFKEETGKPISLVSRRCSAEA